MFHHDCLVAENFLETYNLYFGLESFFNLEIEGM